MAGQSIPENSTNNLTQLHLTATGVVVLLGEVLADIFPDRTVLGGAPFNVARHLKAFGQNPLLITRLGNDELREEVLNVMTQNGMETLGVQTDNTHPTGRVQVHINEGQHQFEILPMQAYDFINPSIVRMATLSVHPRLVYFGTLAQRHDVSKRALKSMLHSTSAEKFLDINLRTPWYDKTTIMASLKYADIIKLNVDELDVLSEMLELSKDSHQNQIIELMNRFAIRKAVITRGEEGAWQIDHNGQMTESSIKHRPQKILDTVGAGDGFAAVFILGKLLHWPVTKTLERANAFAAGICSIRGAIPDQQDFYSPYFKDWHL